MLGLLPTNLVKSAVGEIKGLHHCKLSEEANAGIKEMLETNRHIWKHYYNNYIEKNYLDCGQELNRYLEALRPSSLSLLIISVSISLSYFQISTRWYFWMMIDVVVQHDISSLWELDLNGKVSGSVLKSWCEDSLLPWK